MPSGSESITAVVLAGGASRRMGTPKAQLVLNGSTLLRRVCTAAVESGVSDCVVVGGQPGWADSHAIGVATRWTPDKYPGDGPLGGVVTALGEVTTEWMLVLSCDLVSVQAAALRTMISFADDGIDAVVPLGHRREVLHALYRTEAIRPVTGRFLAGARNMAAVLDGIRVREIPVPSTGVLARSTRDVDTPEEFNEVVTEE